VSTPFTADRVALLTMLAIVVVFGAHSTIDWTWFIPGDACVALLCAGWLAGRGPAETAAAPSALAVAIPRRPDGLRARILGVLGLPAALRRSGPSEIGAGRLLAAVAVIAFALVGAWAQWQPQRSVQASSAAFVALDAHDPARALADARLAVSRDPLSPEALTDLAQVQLSTGNLAGAHATLDRAVTLQPADPQTWLELAALEESSLRDPRAALADLRPAIYLDPTSSEAAGEYVFALRQVQPAASISGAAPAVTIEKTHIIGAGGDK